MDSSEATSEQLEYILKANKILGALNLHWDFSSRHRAWVRSVSDWISYNDIFVEREYDDALVRGLKECGDAFRIMDIGANVGFFLLRALVLRESLAPKTKLTLHGVEGNPKTYEDLCQRIEQQMQVGDHLALHCGVAGDRSGSVKFTDYHFSGWNTLFPKDGSVLKEQSETIQTNYVDLAPVFAELGEIHLLKINAEGAEELILKTYREQLQYAQEISLVVHPAKCNPNNCFNLLKDIGFKDIQKISKNHLYRIRR